MQAASVPDGLAAQLPGPDLCALLAALDPGRVRTPDTVPLVQAWHRLRSYVDARELAAIAELGRRDPNAAPEAPHRLPHPDPDAGGEIAAALTLTEAAGRREHAFAEHLVHRLPAVHAALGAGRIDRAKAWVFAEHTDTLTDPQIAKICDLLLSSAPGLTTGQLRARLQRAIQAIDPQAARRRYQKALRERGVICYLDAEGTATISAGGLDPAHAQAACERLDQLARDTRAAGHPDTLDQIRADLFCALLDGTVHQMNRDQIITTMLTRATDTDTDTGGPGTDIEHAGTDADEQGTDTGPPTETGQATDTESPAETEQPTRIDRCTPAPAPAPSPAGPASPPGERAAPGIEIRVRLSTLLGLDEHPGEIAGLGPILPGPARDTVARQLHAPWRFAVTDQSGHLVLAGTTRSRPAGPLTRHDTSIRHSHGGVVEVQVPATVLAALAADPPPGWRDLIADLAAQYARRHDLLAALAYRPHARFPHEALRRHLEVRDRTCRFPGCRRPARRCQQDHTREYQYGGLTLGDNLGALCVHHHARKTAGHWRLTQPEPGHFLWRSPRGQTYRTRGEPVLTPLPDPEPATAELEPGPPPSVTDGLQQQPTFPTPPTTTGPPAEPRPGRAPPPPTPDDPPF